jgi:zinc-finger-containing domain
MPRTVYLLDFERTEYDLDCPDCGAMMTLVPHDQKVIYRCVRYKTAGCRGSHGAHPDGKPLGIPAPWPVREFRRRTHNVFDLLWRPPVGRLSRSAAYQWLQETMNMTPDQAHISRFDVAQCERVLACLRAEFGLEQEPCPGDAAVDGYFEVSLR